MAEEESTRKAWRAAIKRTVSVFGTDLPIVQSATARWTDKADGTIHTASGDADTSWRPPTLRCVGDDGTWDFDRSGVPPAFDEDKWWPAGTEPGSGLESDDAGARIIVTANGTFAYNADWNGIERATRPVARAARLLHAVRARTDTSRWWSMRCCVCLLQIFLDVLL